MVFSLICSFIVFNYILYTILTMLEEYIYLNIFLEMGCRVNILSLYFMRDKI